MFEFEVVKVVGSCICQTASNWMLYIYASKVTFQSVDVECCPQTKWSKNKFWSCKFEIISKKTKKKSNILWNHVQETQHNFNWNIIVCRIRSNAVKQMNSDMASCASNRDMTMTITIACQFHECSPHEDSSMMWVVL